MVDLDPHFGEDLTSRPPAGRRGVGDGPQERDDLSEERVGFAVAQLQAGGGRGEDFDSRPGLAEVGDPWGSKRLPAQVGHLNVILRGSLHLTDRAQVKPRAEGVRPVARRGEEYGRGEEEGRPHDFSNERGA